MIVIRLLFLCLLVAVVHSQKWKCDKNDVKEVDNYVSLLFTIGRKDRKFPVTPEELKDYCKDHRQYIAKVESYKDQCLKEKPKQIVGVIVYSFKAILKNYCKNLKAKRTQDLLRSAGCANKQTQEYHLCHMTYLNTLMEIKDYKTPRNKEKLEQMCCGYVDVLGCIRGAGTKGGCSEKHIETNLDFIRSYFQSAVDILCSEYHEHTDKCDKVVRVKGKERKGRPKTVFQPLVEILGSL